MPAIVLVIGKKEGCNKMNKKVHFVTAPFFYFVGVATCEPLQLKIGEIRTNHEPRTTTLPGMYTDDAYMV